jgi:glucokinase
MTSILALDFGGTKHTLGVLEEGGREWRTRQQVFSPPGADARYDMETVFKLARQLLHGNQPAAIGVSFGGPVDASTSTVRLSHHVPGWENIPLGKILREEFNAPAQVDNDANVAALGEGRFGAGQGMRSMFYITVSTGVGGGWLLDRQIWHGSDGMAGEIGHTVVQPDGPTCLCGKRGCVERLASGRYMALDARLRLQEDSKAGPILWNEYSSKLETLDGKALSRAASQGDPLACQLLERSAWALGVGIGNAANLLNPQRFILGGGVTKAGEAWWQMLRDTARQTALPEVHFDILPAALGDDAPLWGAATLALDLLMAR